MTTPTNEKGYAAIVKLFREAPAEQRRLLSHELWQPSKQCGCALGFIAYHLGVLVPSHTMDTESKVAQFLGLPIGDVVDIAQTNDNFIYAGYATWEAADRARFEYMQHYFEIKAGA